MAIQGIPESGRSRVYRKIADQLRTDPVLEAAGVKWIVSLGDGRDAPAENIKAPTIRLLPTLESQGWASVDAQSGEMAIQVEMYVPSPKRDVRDWMDLWTALEHALCRPGDRAAQKDFRRRLVGCGEGEPGPDAETGEIRFVRPATVEDVDADKVFAFRCRGAMSITILRVVNP